MANSTLKTKSRTPFIIVGLVLAIIGGPILMLPVRLLLNVVLGNPAVNTSDMATVNIVTLLVWPICFVAGILIATMGGRKKH
jgi:hypothetical protein